MNSHLHEQRIFLQGFPPSFSQSLHFTSLWAQYSRSEVVSPSLRAHSARMPGPMLEIVEPSHDTEALFTRCRTSLIPRHAGGERKRKRVRMRVERESSRGRIVMILKVVVALDAFQRQTTNLN